MSTQPRAFRHARVHNPSRQAAIALLMAFLLLVGLSAPAHAVSGTGTVTGTVTSSAGAPAEGVSVTAYRGDPEDSDWFTPFESTVTDSAGDYNLELPADTYRICFGEEYGSNPQFLAGCHGSRLVWDATDVFVGDGASVTVDGQVTPASHIAGTVTDADGQPLDSVEVVVYKYYPEWGEWDYAEGVSTNENGTYDAALPAGTYRVGFRDYLRRGNVSEYYENADTIADATDVVVDGGTTTIDAQLARSGSISGHIDLPEWAEDEGSVRVIDQATGKVVAGGRANRQGDYTIRGLQSGSYKVAFNRLSGQAYSAPQFFDGKQEGVGLAGAEGVDVVFGEQTSGVDATLVPGGQISGFLVDSDGNALDGCHVQAYTADGSLVTRAGYTSWDGSFAITGLSTGEYLLRVVDDEWEWRHSPCDGGTQFYTADDGRLSMSEEGGIWVGATLGEDTALTTNLTYTRGATINGHVELPAGALDSDRRLRLLSAESGEVVAAASADEDGNFSIEGLAAGSYKVAYNRLSGQAYAAAQFFDGKQEGVGLDGAHTVTVGLGETAGNVDATLVEGGHVTGTLTNATGDPLACRVQAFTNDGHLVTRSAMSDETGTFDISGLSTGDYLVRVVPSGDCAAGIQYVHGGGGTLGSKATADPVSVTVGDSIHLDPTLVYADAVAISGTVTMTEEMSYDDASVHVVDATTGEQVAGFDYGSDDTFTYSIDGLAPGSYRVDFARSSGSAIAAGQFFDNVEEGDVANADIVDLAPGEQAENIDAVLQAGGNVRGRIVDSAGEPLKCTVQMFRPDESLATRYGHSRADNGTFDMTGLSTGGYLLLARSYDCGYPGKYYGGPGLFVDDITDAVPVQAHLGEVTQLSQDLVFGDGATLPVVNDQLPEVDGNAVVGGTLTASPGIWTPADAAFTYEWLADGEVIADVTGSTYSPVATDVGKTIRVRVTATKPGFEDGVATSAATAPVAQPTVSNSAVPTITGTPVVGKTLTASPGTWTPADSSLAYEWLANDVAIADATGTTYVPVAGDVGKTIKVRVTASQAGYTEGVATSAATSPVTAEVVIANQAKPTISGTPRVGAKLTASPGTWTPEGLTYTYEWYVGDSATLAGVGTTYKVPPTDLGKTIVVKVTAAKAGLESASASSAPTAAVKVGVFTIVKEPKIKGVAKVGRTLTALPGAVSPTAETVKYRWLRDGKAIRNATKVKYKLTKADKGHRIQVKVTYERAAHAELVKKSARTGKVAV